MARTSMTAAHFAARTLCVRFVLIPAICAAHFSAGPARQLQLGVKFFF